MVLVAPAAAGVSALVLVAGLPLGYVLVQEEGSPPPMVRFDGGPDNLAHFLAQVWHHMECYGEIYPDDATWAHVVSNLEGSASGWLVSLHNEKTLELNDLDAFMQTVQE